MTRTFEAKPARRERTPIMMGIVSPSGAGKTKSALRIADGFARVMPGPIVVIDTEAKRALHHSDAHRFMHIDMAPPFGPADHVAAWQEALRHGPSTIIQDSMSHEHDGPGGLLEMHDLELDRMAGNDWKKRERCTMAAWIKPKAEHNKMRHFMLQQRVNWILCFRAKEKIKPVKGGEPLDLGWQSLGAEDLIYEMLLKVLLFPGADGQPTWRSDKIGEQALMKLPGWFRDLFAAPRQLDEDIGEQLARWAAGGDVTSGTAGALPPASMGVSTRPGRAGLAERFDACAAPEEYDELCTEMRRDWESIPKGAARTKVTEAFKRAQARMQRAAQTNEPPAISAEEAAEIDRIERQERQST